jgi:hypothetical protein
MRWLARLLRSDDVEPWDDWPMCPDCQVRFPTQEQFANHLRAEIADAIEDEAARMYRAEYRRGEVSIAYVDGFEAAARIAREHARPEVTR